MNILFIGINTTNQQNNVLKNKTIIYFLRDQYNLDKPGKCNNHG